jgi:hypothetical protein
MSTSQDNSFDPSQRRLCPDGSCVGLLGSDGRCKVCGTRDPARAGVAPAENPPASPTPQPEPNKNNSEPEPATASDAEASFDPTRRLCPDDACIGVIGSDNKCSVCGRLG